MLPASKPLSIVLYVVGVAVIFLAVYSQYFIDYGPVIGYFVVYGIPIVVVSLIFGRELLARFAKNNKKAAQLGLGLFGVLTVVAILIMLMIVSILLRVDPQITSFLNKPNPVLNVPPNEAWIFVGLSFLVVGPVEEYLFRGFMYGGLLSVSKGKYWFPIAVGSSVMFAAVHAYYAFTYGIASALAFVDLAAFGIAMCITFYWSGGNLLVPALIHGAYDASGFLGVATTTTVGVIARSLLIVLGLIFALIYLPAKIRLNPIPTPTSPGENPGTTSSMKSWIATAKRRFLKNFGN